MRLIIKLLSILIAVAFLSGIYSCDSKKAEEEDTTELEYSDDITKIVIQVTAGEIQSDDKIEVKFVENVVEQSKINSEIDNPFKFTPSISGKAKWENRKTLVFIPEDPLKTRINYTAKIDLQSLSKNFKKKSLEAMDLKFFVQGRDISAFKADLELQNANNPKLLVYKGKISFNQKTNLKNVQEASSFSSITLNWSKESDQTFTFISDAVKREDNSKDYSFVLDKNDLDLAENFEKVVEIAPLEQLKILAVERDEQGKYPKMMLKFSDDLDYNQQIEGYITVNPDVEFKTQKLGKYIMLDGKFKFGSKYTIKVEKGLKSRWGTTTKNIIEKTVDFVDIQPQIEFASEGIFMPTSNKKRLQFLSTNLKRVHVEIKKILNNNIENVFKRESLNSKKQRNTEFRQSYVSSVGAIIYNQTLEIGDTKNEWLLHNIDLSNVLNNYNNGLYLIRVNFNPSDVLVPLKEDELGYIQKKGQIYKPFTISDIGIIAKKYDRDELMVFTTDLISGMPIEGVKITALNYSDSYRGTTNVDGKAYLRANYYDLIKAEKNDQVSIIKPREMTWNNSGYEVGGLSVYDLKTRAYIYTERGVYRPGDSVNVSCIVRYHNKSSQDNIPAYFKLFNPEGTLVHESTQKGVKDSFYNFGFTTNQSDPTGDWRIQIIVGNKYFYHTLKIETVVANRLKAKITPTLKTILPENKNINLDLEAKYLFGASAANLSFKTDVEIYEAPSPFSKYRNYLFKNRMVKFQEVKSRLSGGTLDDKGKGKVSWKVPVFRNAPGPLLVKFNAAVSEKAGRPVNTWSFADIHPFTHYIGIENRDNYVKLNSKVDIPIIIVDHKGNAVSGREVNYRIYRNDSYWWYQYSNYRSFKLKYKTDSHTHLVEEGTITSATNGSALSFHPSQKGQYLIEVQDAKGGHITSKFLSAYPWGGLPSSDKNAGTLSLRSTKNTYEMGEEVTITFPSPKKGNVLLTVEQGDQIILDKWVKPNQDQDEMSTSFRVTDLMVPNIYVTVTVLQDHSQTLNDRPIRMFGILPLNIIDPKSKQKLVIDMPDELEPKQSFDINIKTLNGKQTQFTLALVDEGLLDLTNFKTPDPWKKFYQNIRLEVTTYDMFGHVIGANKGDVFKTFSIGGDEDYRKSQVDPFKKKKRFKPVCIFKGPMMTGINGKAKVHINMPNYVGSVRVMVISADEGKYGSEEKTVPVRSDLIVQPTIPRALKPGDEFDIPVNVFATKDNIGAVDLKIETEGPIEIIGDKIKKHSFEKEDDQMFFFKAKVKSAVGQSKISISCKSKGAESSFEADVPVSPASARVYVQEQKIIKPGESITMKIPKVGLEGTNQASLHLSIFPNMDFVHRLDYLIRYPYGCIEQTTSAVFPQVMLKDVLITKPDKKAIIDRNVNAGIERLMTFQLPNGGFSYWPGGQQASEWGSNYAAHFLIEARKNGYLVPDVMYNGIIRYLENQSRYSRNTAGSKSYNLMLKVNRCMILALADKAPLKELNILKQNSYNQLNNVQKWQLVAAYKLAGAEDKIKDIVNQIKTDVSPYKEFSYSYGSNFRDLGIILRCLVIMNRDADSELMAKEVAKVLSTRRWYSTQSVGQMLIGIASYFKKIGISGKDDVILEGEIAMPMNQNVLIKSVDQYSLDINYGYGEEFKLTLDEDVNIKQLYATLSANGVPLKDQTKEENKNLKMEVDWYDEDGNSITIDNVKQGTSIYGHYKITNTSVVPIVDEIALVQLFPSGWEIENTRLSNSLMPSWMKNWNLNKEEYLDIRDDRIMWFFDLNKRKSKDFVVKINTVSTGSYELPGARCEAMYDNDFVATKAAKKVKVYGEE